MDPVSVVAIAFGLAMDAFAVAVASSAALGKVTLRQVARLAFFFGIFQALMPIVGWLAGIGVEEWVSAWDHWVAFALLSAIGVKAIVMSFRGEGQAPKRDPTRGVTLVVLSLATSMDALAVGFSFAMIEVSVWYPVAVIGLVAAGMTVAGMLLGCRLGARLGRRAELVGGLVLIAIGVKILVNNTLAA